jgi:hypothetical protein
MWSKNTFVPLATVPVLGIEFGGGFGFEVHAVSLVASYAKLNFGSGVQAVGLVVVVGVGATALELLFSVAFMFVFPVVFALSVLVHDSEIRQLYSRAIAMLIVVFFIVQSP